jgi:hypothetical protein
VAREGDITRCLGKRRTVGVLFALVIVAGLAASTSDPVAATVDPGVQNVTAVVRLSPADSIVFVSWTPATAAQRQGLAWTSVYFGGEPMPILVFGPTITDVTIPQVLPGTYRVAVEFDYGDRSNYTRTARGLAVVTVGRRRLPAAAPLALVGVTAATTGQRVTVTWRHDPAEKTDQRPFDYVVSIGDTRVAVVPDYATVTRRFTQVAPGVYPVTVVARNSAGDSPAASGPPIVVASPGPPAPRADAGSPLHWPGNGPELFLAISALGILAAIAALARSLFPIRPHEPKSRWPQRDM